MTHLDDSETKTMKMRLTLNLLLLTLLSVPLLVQAQGTAFTYQGHLTANGTSANGIYELQFTIFDLDVAGSTIGAPITNSLTSVSNGLFVATLDFGAGVFDG